MKTEKICKGLGRARGNGCLKMVPVNIGNKPNRILGLGQLCKCYQTWLATSDEGKKILDKAIYSGKRKVSIQNNKSKKEAKAKKNQEKSLSNDWSKKLQTEVNSIVRTIDKGLTCLARNQRGQIHAGHVYARGGNSTIKYNLHNIHRQSAQSNHHQNDDGKLREGVVNEYGSDYMEFISNLRRTPMLNFSNAEYRVLTTKARKILKSLKEEDRIYSLSERIEMRNRINIELKIYDKEYCVFK